MDTTDPDIVFDENGFCNHCRNAEEKLRKPPFGLSKVEKEARLLLLIDKIKNSGRNEKYDCIIGISGGIDSTFVAYKVVEYGLKPLAVHIDNGWNTEISSKNVNNICNKLGLDLVHHEINWSEFRNLEIAFLKASTPDLEVTTDHAIASFLYQQAVKNKVKNIITGVNNATESILPSKWSSGHNDWRYIKSINKLFGKSRISSIPHRNLTMIAYYKLVTRIKMIDILDYTEYEKSEAIKLITEQLGWEDYGGKHCESIITKFWQGYVLPTKFGYDKRKAHLSSLIVSDQITRLQALEELKRPPYTTEELNKDLPYVCERLGISSEDFEKIMRLPTKSFNDYPSYHKRWYFKILEILWKKSKNSHYA